LLLPTVLSMLFWDGVLNLALLLELAGIYAYGIIDANLLYQFCVQYTLSLAHTKLTFR